MAVSFNGKLLLGSTLYPPQYGFDADLCKIRIDNRDYRDDSLLEYSIAGGNYIRVYDGVISDYSLPAIDTLYNLSIRQTPQHSKYEGNTLSDQIFKNHENCKYFKYSGDSYTSTDIYAYIGSSANIVIPTKHNMNNTLTATLTSFPNVVLNSVSVTTPLYMSSFWIKESRISRFDILCSSFRPIASQFKDLQNLYTIDKHNVTWSSIPQECFKNCTSFNPGDDFFKLTTSMGTDALYNTPALTTLLFSCTSTADYGQPKTVFTTQSTIDNLQEMDLFDTPISNTNTVFVGANDANWSVNPAESDAYIVPLGFNDTNTTQNIEGVPCEGNSYLFKASDPNIIGYKLSRKSSSYTTAKMVHIPQQVHNIQADNPDFVQGTSINTNLADYSFVSNGDKYFVISAPNLENNKESHLVDASDTIYIQGFDRTGYLSRTIARRLDGKLFPTFQHKIAYWTKSADSTLRIRQKTGTNTYTEYVDFETGVPAYRLYLYLDALNCEKVRIRLMDRDNNAYIQIVNDTLANAFHATSNSDIYYIDLASYLDVNTILATTPKAVNGDTNTNWPTYLDDINDFKLDVSIRHADGSAAVPVSGTNYNTTQYVPDGGSSDRLTTWQRLSFTLS